MPTLNLSDQQLHDLIAAMDNARTNYRIEALDAEERGQEASAQRYYDVADRYEALILALQTQPL